MIDCNSSSSSSKRAARRTRKQLKIDIMSALERLIIERGFMNIPMLTLVKEAGIDPNVFYRHYGTIDKLYDEFAGQYDFWLNDTLNISDLRKLGDRRFYAESLKTLYSELEKNKVMQKLLVWELSDNNSTTRKTANIREKLNLNLMAYYEDIFKASGIDIKYVTALLIAGIYYLVLHRERSTFCSVDFNTDEGRKHISNAIDMLVDILFDKLEANKKQQKMIQRMLNDGISEAKIAEYLGLSLYQLKKITEKSEL